MSENVAVVTESAKGLGFAIIKGLCEKYNGTVYLTSNNAKSGLEAIETLKKLDLKPVFHVLDLSDKASVKTFALFLKENHGGLDVLVNNVPPLESTHEYPDFETAKNNIVRSFGSFLTIEELLFPLLRNGARVVNISSDCGHLSNLRDQKWIDQLRSPDLTTKEVKDFVSEYLESVESGTFEKNNFANEGKHADERVAKVAVTALTMVQQRRLNLMNISVNAVYPGLSTNGVAEKEPDEAAKSVLYLILDASPNLKGTFMWQDRKLVDWYDVEDDEGAHYCKF